MTRIGLAFNQKPEAAEAAGTIEAVQHSTRNGDGEAARPDEEPPGTSDEFAEWDSRETIDAVAAALSQLGEVIRLEADETFPERLRRVKPDIVFNMAEGLTGVNRESQVPAICEFYGIPYSGSDPLTLALCLDKARAKEVLSFHGVLNAPFVVVRSAAETENAETLTFPVFAKPLHEGSSKGITGRNLCRTREELDAQVSYLLDHYRQPVIIEEYLPGAEFTCAILGNDDTARVLPIVGMNFDSLPDGALPIYGFEAKWIWDRPERPLEIFDCPARIDDSLARSIERVALDAYHVLACRDWARIDVRLDSKGQPNIIEVNPLPGILPDPADNSCFPKAARAAGMSYDELIQNCLLLAARRHGLTLGRSTEVRQRKQTAKRTRSTRTTTIAPQAELPAATTRLIA